MPVLHTPSFFYLDENIIFGYFLISDEDNIQSHIYSEELLDILD